MEGATARQERPILSHTVRARTALEECLRVSGPWSHIAEAQVGRFNLWAANIGAFARYKASLDDRLRDATEVVDIITSLLDILCIYAERGEKTLLLSIPNCGSRPHAEDITAVAQTSVDQVTSEKRPPSNGVDNNHTSFASNSVDQDSRGECLAEEITTEEGITAAREASRTQPPSELSTLPALKAVEESISRLHRLSTAIRNAGTRNPHSRIANFKVVDEDGNDINTVFEDFVKRVLDVRLSHMTENLRTRIGASICFRRRRFLYNKPSQERGKRDESGSTQPPQKVGDSLPVPSPLAESSRKYPATIVSTAARRSIFTSRTASTFQPHKFQAPRPSESSVVSTATPLSFVRPHNSVIPKPPKLRKDQKEEQCPYCPFVLSAQEFCGTRWITHFLRDLEPYICLLEECTSPNEVYGTVKQWAEHMGSHYRQSTEWTCSMHKSNREGRASSRTTIVFKTVEDFMEHVNTQHPNRFTDSQITTLLARSARPASIFPTCPFCDWSPPPFSIEAPITRGKPTAMEEHVASHLLDLAILSLPPLWEKEGEDEEEDSLKGASMKTGEQVSRSEFSQGQLLFDDDNEIQPQPPHSAESDRAVLTEEEAAVGSFGPEEAPDTRLIDPNFLSPKDSDVSLSPNFKGDLDGGVDETFSWLEITGKVQPDNSSDPILEHFRKQHDQNDCNHLAQAFAGQDSEVAIATLTPLVNSQSAPSSAGIKGASSVPPDTHHGTELVNTSPIPANVNVSGLDHSVEDDLSEQQVFEAGVLSSASDSPSMEGNFPVGGETTDNVSGKRRPRKHPLPVPGDQGKVTKGRPNSSCITCRLRNMTCDKRKPACLNCQKSALFCQGYLPIEKWKSGRQNMGEAVRNQSTAPCALPFLIDGIETDIDLRLHDHFVYGFSRVVTLINDDSNPFKEILLPMATQHRGLMHSLMCLSGSHLGVIDPEPRLIERKYYHLGRAVIDLKDDLNALPSSSDGKTELIWGDHVIASILALVVYTICEGKTNGEYRTHMDGARSTLNIQMPKHEKFREFIVEFFHYHDVCNSIASLDRRPAHFEGYLRLPHFVPHAQAGAFLGVLDGLFECICDVTRLRDRVRQRFNEGYEPAVDYQILNEAVAIDSAIRSWETSYPANTPNYFLAQLYRQSTWIYLYRTIRPSQPSEKISQIVDDGLAYLDQIPHDAGANSLVLMPLFLLGCSAFNPSQRERITTGFEAAKSYSNLRNIEPSFLVVGRVWEVMDTKTEDSWDWEMIMKNMNMDFLIT